MWLLTVLPDWFWSVLIASGIVLLTVSWMVKVYQLPIQLISISAIIVGVWFEGASYNNSVWESKVHTLEEQVKIAESKSKTVKEKIVYKTREKIVKVKQKVEVIRTEIKIQKEIINEGCKLNPIAVEIYNKSVNGTVDIK